MMYEHPDYLKTSPRIKEKPLDMAHFMELQFVHPKMNWEDGAAALRSAFPREAIPQRGAHWYRLLQESHWPGRIPPGNGPFYIPEWALHAYISEGLEQERFHTEKQGKSMFESAIKAVGFKEIPVNVAVLPPDSGYLISAMRAAGPHPWNACPLLYRAYIYPKLAGWGKRPLRDYNTTPWKL